MNNKELDGKLFQGTTTTLLKAMKYIKHTHYLKIAELFEAGSVGTLHT